MTKHFAYIVLAHREPKQLAQLLEVLNHEDDHFFVHIDRKVSIEPFQEEIRKLRIPNIHFIGKRENGQWGGMGIVYATINAIDEIVSLDTPFCHVHLLSGQDFPIKSIQEIRRFFSDHDCDDFMSYEPFPVRHLDGGGLHRLKNYSWTIRGRRLTYLPKSISNTFNIKGQVLNTFLGLVELFLPERKIPHELKPFYGSQWWSLTGETVKNIRGYLALNPEYCRFHRRSLLPDEMFFQTVLLNLEDTKPPINDNKRFILWEEGSSHPIELELKHLTRIEDSDALFARKFNFDNPILKSLTSTLKV